MAAAVLASWAATCRPWRHGSYEYQQRSGGLGPLWAWLGAPLLLPGLLLLWRRRRTALVTLLPVLAVLLVQPYRWWARFTLPLAAVGVLAVLVVDARCRRPGAGGAPGRDDVLVLLGAGLVLVEANPRRAQTPAGAAGPRARGDPPRAHGRGALPPRVRVPGRRAAGRRRGGGRRGPAAPLPHPPVRTRPGRTVLPSGAAEVPDDAWVVTGEGRALDLPWPPRGRGPTPTERVFACGRRADAAPVEPSSPDRLAPRWTDPVVAVAPGRPRARDPQEVRTGSRRSPG